MSGHQTQHSPAHGAPAPTGQGGGGRGRLAVIVVIALALVLAVWGLVQRHGAYVDLAKKTTEASFPRVQLISPSPGPTSRKLDLPSNISAWYLAPIYAQVSGYVKMWYKDIGAKVHKGDLLAEIQTPGLDAQYAASKANLDVALARYKIADVTAKRWKALQGTQAVSQQEVDVQAANAAAQQAQVEAAQHDVEQFQALEAFKRIVAPFDGVVTARFADVGDYVNAGRGDVNSNGTATELFSVADVHAMRVYVSVPQDYADIVGPDLQATLTLPQFPDRVFHARYLTTAGAFDTNTRTVRTELMVDNDDGVLWPDSYATAHFVAPGDPSILTLPEGALIFRAEGMQVAMVDATNHVHLVPVKVGTNLGTMVQILSGLKREDKVINNPSAGLLDGEEVRVVPGTPGYDAPSVPQKTPGDAHQDNVRAMPNDNAPGPEAGSRQ
ncbi:multidrug efflux pump acriflavin resistance protein AcrB/AcrD/AcrF [Acetobacter nitrogenifigens DSM 23921 = NBRC 105050]|uniref:RND transporter MFP subunit n=1 Tax=Acetobacter nitrogenifigens DSM 23921 = NBRC 105050 TaxID=1120919 RepID=A0A511X9G1_9PROT|nr:efflux RND transporter periplasmic adaptor subunit [Acetobacter nitrogenifigens]GBQ93512.1 multidrug efflux pump acriflavin resistance protein AcrB/AcrD/AcrF [Acetobacter nitrogenifigens DSM 23921 = NBRC 105050]GEN59587.1 RND transporter MFP subunit [Acetobacter nitrogenifigens DSM 23921 = NBRC 105050]